MFPLNPPHTIISCGNFICFHCDDMFMPSGSVKTTGPVASSTSQNITIQLYIHSDVHVYTHTVFIHIKAPSLLIAPPSQPPQSLHYKVLLPSQ